MALLAIQDHFLDMSIYAVMQITIQYDLIELFLISMNGNFMFFIIIGSENSDVARTTATPIADAVTRLHALDIIYDYCLASQSLI